jgi:AhpD family alkylhydroperoxidase
VRTPDGVRRVVEPSRHAVEQYILRWRPGLSETAGARALVDLLPYAEVSSTPPQRAVMVEGALSVKVKELIALAIAATRECDGCIASHARGAARAQATEAEVAEAMGVVVMMNGGSGTVWGPRAAAAHREFSEPASQT